MTLEERRREQVRSLVEAIDLQVLTLESMVKEQLTEAFSGVTANTEDWSFWYDIQIPVDSLRTQLDKILGVTEKEDEKEEVDILKEIIEKILKPFNPFS